VCPSGGMSPGNAWFGLVQGRSNSAIQSDS
jgi:hypothetical protein